MDRIEEILTQVNLRGCTATLNSSAKQSMKSTLSVSEDSLVVTASGSSLLFPFTDMIYIKKIGENSLEIASLGFGTFGAADGCFGCCNLRRRRNRDRRLSRLVLAIGQPVDPTSLIQCLSEISFGKKRTIGKTKALVVVNPIAGRGLAQSLWQHTVEPLMKQSDQFDYEVITTDGPGHALEIGSRDLTRLLENSLPDGKIDSSFERRDEKLFLIVLGGDGIVYELINGIHKARPDTYKALLANLVLCPLPAGSGNGLCYSALCLARESFHINSALRLLFREEFAQKDLGIVHYQNSDGDDESKLFALTISWGLVADVDLQSEFLRRYVGESRFAVYGLLKVLKKQSYEGTIAFDDYHEIEPDYLTVVASLVPAAGRTVILSPTKPMADGTIRVHRIRSRDVSRYGLIQAMGELEKRRDHSKRIKGFEPLITDKFELIPGLVHSLETTSKRGGSSGIVLDGEPLTFGPIRVEVLPSACNVFSSSQILP